MKDLMIKNKIKYITSKIELLHNFNFYIVNYIEMNLWLLEFYGYIKINGKLRGKSKFDMDKFYNVALWYTFRYTNLPCTQRGHEIPKSTR